MQPSLKTVRAGLRRTTEALATHLAAPRPATAAPGWSELEWRLAAAAAAAHGVSPLLFRRSGWQHPQWREFLQIQHDHVAHRYDRIVQLLERIDLAARSAGLAIVPLKGSALHALDIYLPGERPMADVDLLVRECDTGASIQLLTQLGYVESFANWKHRVFKPFAGEAIPGLGEHRDNQITIELHTRIQERLPVSVVDITARIYPRDPAPGLNPYPSTGALMSHLLLHTAGNICGRSVRLLNLNDIARLAARMKTEDWNVLCDKTAAGSAWWALPPLRLTARYFRNAVPEWVLERVDSECPALLRVFARRQTLSRVSSSDVWVQALPGIEWCATVGEAARYLKGRFWRSRESARDRAAHVPTQHWLRGQNWDRLSRGRLILMRLTRGVPRPDTLYVIRAALARNAAGGHPH